MKTRRVKRKNKERFQSFFVVKQGLDFGLWESDSCLLICFCVRILPIILASVNHIFLNFVGSYLPKFYRVTSVSYSSRTSVNDLEIELKFENLS
jgi:hypothetical protein